MLSHNITENLSPMMTHAIGQHIPYVSEESRRTRWEAALMPDKDGRPQYTVFVWMPGSSEGTVINGSFVLRDPIHITQDELVEVMGEFLGKMREARDQEARKQQEQESGQQPSGLIVP